MPRGYVIMTEVIHDAETMAAHGAVTYDSLVEHGAKMLVVDANYEVREGTWDESSRIAIMEFGVPCRSLDTGMNQMQVKKPTSFVPRQLTAT